MNKTIIHQIFREEFHDLVTTIINQESIDIQNSLREAYLNLNIGQPIPYEQLPNGIRRRRPIEYIIRSTIVKVTNFFKIVVSIFHKYFATGKYYLTHEENQKYLSPMFHDIIFTVLPPCAKNNQAENPQVLENLQINSQLPSIQTIDPIVPKTIKFELLMIPGIRKINKKLDADYIIDIALTRGEKPIIEYFNGFFTTGIFGAEILIYDLENLASFDNMDFRCACDYCRKNYESDIDYYMEQRRSFLSRCKNGFEIRISLHEHLKQL